MGKFDGKVVIITGASSGIGAATAVAFAKEGAKLVISGRNKERLAATAKECKATKNCQVLEVLGDLTVFENLEGLVKKTVDKFKGIDILVNNAGYGQCATIEQVELDKFENLFKANVTAPVFLCKYALPHLKKSKGSVVNISSTAGLRASPTFVPYCMTKCALDHFTRGFAAECAQFGIRVNSVNPAAVQTRFGDNLAVPTEDKDEFIKNLLKRQPFGMIQPDEIAESILYLSSNQHITGDTLKIDGGIMLN